MDFSNKEKRAGYLAERGIFPIRIPIPLIVNHVNAYYIDGPTPILIDTGFFGDRPFATLVDALAACGRAVDDIGMVLLTHGHRDHSGMARRIREASGARVLLHERDTPILGPDSFSDYLKRVFVYYRDMGVTPERIRETESHSSGERDKHWEEVRYDDRQIIDGFIREGDRFESGAGAITAIETPGHTGGSVSFLLKEQNILFSGDLISIASDPLPLVTVQREADGWLNLYDDYRVSLDLLCRIDPALLLPGHGGAISQGRRLAQRIIGIQERNTAKVEQAVRSNKSQTIAALTQSIYPDAFGPILTNALNVVRGISILLAKEGKIGFDGEGMVRAA